MADEKHAATRIVFTGGADVMVGEPFDQVRDAIYMTEPEPDYIGFRRVDGEQIGITVKHVAFIEPVVGGSWRPT